MSRKSVAQKDSKTPKQNGASARSKPRVSPVFHVARLVLINAMAKARVPTEEIAAKLGVNRSYVIRQCVMNTQPANASERAIAKLASEYEGHFRKLGLHGLLGEGFTTLLAGDPRREDSIRVVRLAGPGGPPKFPKPSKPPKQRTPKASATVKAAAKAAKAAVKEAVKAAEKEAVKKAKKAEKDTSVPATPPASVPSSRRERAKPKAGKKKARETIPVELTVELLGDPDAPLDPEPAPDTSDNIGDNIGDNTSDEWSDDSELVNDAVPGTGVTVEEILDRAESES